MSGKAVGLLFEDDGDGYGYTEGRYLITHYIAERQSSIVTVKILKSEGEWERPKRRIHVQLLLGGGAMVLFFHLLKKIYMGVYKFKRFKYYVMLNSLMLGEWMERLSRLRCLQKVKFQR